MFKKLWEKIKAWFKNLWEMIKAWWNKTALPWLKISWMQIVNMIVLFIAYKGFNELTQPWFSFAVGGWLFLLLGYYIFWKLFGAEKMFKK